MLSSALFNTPLTSQRRVRWTALSQRFLPVLLASCVWLLFADPAQAHHPFGGQTPSNFMTGFFSGMGHPVIGIDHLVFVIAAGLLAAVHRRGLAIPVMFCLTSVMGTGIHLMSWDLPAPEFVISGSVLAFGLLLATKQSWNWAGVIVGGAIAGIFHGYAYGEAIVGAQMTPLVAYLAGFTLIQLAIALSAAAIGRSVIARAQHPMPDLPLRFAGFTVCGAGIAFLSSVLLA